MYVVTGKNKNHTPLMVPSKISTKHGIQPLLYWGVGLPIGINTKYRGTTPPKGSPKRAKSQGLSGPLDVKKMNLQKKEILSQNTRYGKGILLVRMCR